MSPGPKRWAEGSLLALEAPHPLTAVLQILTLALQSDACPSLFAHDLCHSVYPKDAVDCPLLLSCKRCWPVTLGSHSLKRLEPSPICADAWKPERMMRYVEQSNSRWHQASSNSPCMGSCERCGPLQPPTNPPQQPCLGHPPCSAPLCQERRKNQTGSSPMQASVWNTTQPSRPLTLIFWLKSAGSNKPPLQPPTGWLVAGVVIGDWLLVGWWLTGLVGGVACGGRLRYSAVRTGSISLIRGHRISDTNGLVSDALQYAIRVLLKQPCKQ